MYASLNFDISVLLTGYKGWWWKKYVKRRVKKILPAQSFHSTAVLCVFAISVDR
jgi:hypothetical protein